MLLKKAEVPQLTVGRTSTEARIRIAETGQVVFNSLATKKMLESSGIQASNVSEIFLDWTPEKRELLMSLKAPKGAKEGDGFNAKIGAKSELLTFSGTSLFRHLGYDFAKSGSQMFSLTSKNGSGFHFVLPTELTPVEKKVRAKKAKKEVPATAAPVAVEEAELALV